jgi:hypothetical protein
MIINSESVARELMDKRSAIYSDRPVVRTNELYVLLVIIQQVLDLLTRQDWNGFQYYIPSVWRNIATTPHDLPPSPEG